MAGIVANQKENPQLRYIILCESEDRLNGKPFSASTKEHIAALKARGVQVGLYHTESSRMIGEFLKSEAI